eukprot:765790-Hanusia_phi.AAC.13
MRSNERSEGGGGAGHYANTSRILVSSAKIQTSLKKELAAIEYPPSHKSLDARGGDQICNSAPPTVMLDRSENQGAASCQAYSYHPLIPSKLDE